MKDQKSRPHLLLNLPALPPVRLKQGLPSITVMTCTWYCVIIDWDHKAWSQGSREPCRGGSMQGESSHDSQASGWASWDTCECVDSCSVTWQHLESIGFSINCKVRELVKNILWGQQCYSAEWEQRIKINTDPVLIQYAELRARTQWGKTQTAKSTRRLARGTSSSLLCQLFLDLGLVTLSYCTLLQHHSQYQFPNLIKLKKLSHTQCLF